MRRRARPLTAEDMPPARLVEYREQDWLSLVDPADYNPNRWRGITGGRHAGEPELSRREWREREAVVLWARARFAWQLEHGWPGGLGLIDLIKETHLLRQGHRPTTLGASHG